MECEKSTRVEKVFAKAKKDGKKVFIAFITCGFPSLEETISLLLAYQEGGADIIELGVPFSDPQADGPIIQHAHQVAVKQDVSYTVVLETLNSAREAGLKVPVVLMGYLNPFLSYGLENLFTDTKKMGGDGFIIPDLPLVEAKRMKIAESCQAANLAFIPLVSPTTSDARMKTTASIANGFIYCVSSLGVTGGQSQLLSDTVSDFMNRVRKNIPSHPLAIGFGLSTRDHVQQAGTLADGAIMGSKLIMILGQEYEGGATARKQKIVSYLKSII